MIEKKFESKFGFDANGETITNLGNPVEMSDGVNKFFYEQYKGVLTYSSTRGYPLGFMTLYDGSLYLSNGEIKSPAGVFDPTLWTLVKSIPSWKVVSSVTTRLDLTSSDHLLVDTTANALEIYLPRTPKEGETVYIYDVGGKVGYNSLTVKSIRRNVKFDVDSDTMLETVLLTTPNSMTQFVFSNAVWNVKQFSDIGTLTRIVPPNIDSFNAQSNQIIKSLSTTKENTFKLTLPNFANTGDTITFQSLSKGNTYLEVSMDALRAINVDGNKTFRFNTYKEIKFVYDASVSRWNSIKSVKDKKIDIVSSASYTIEPNVDIMLNKTATVILPQKPSMDESVYISLLNVPSGDNVTIQTVPSIVANSIKIEYLSNKLGAISSDLHFINSPKMESKITFNPTDRRLNGLELIFKGDRWVISKYESMLFYTNPKTPEHAGIIPLVNDDDITKNVMDNNNVAITPSQLQKRISTTTRMGITALATQSEVLAGVVTNKVVTPNTLHGTKASESQQGLLLIASQNEVNVGTNHTKSVTPLTLDNKLPDENGKRGVVTLTPTTNVVAGTTRTTIGTGIYKRDDAVKVVTPKALSQLIATENAMGISYKATESEVLSGVSDVADRPLFVSPYTLSRRTATPTRTGIAKLTTKTTVLDTSNDLDIVTPSTLHSVQATHSLKGLAMFWDSDSIPSLGTELNGLSNVKDTLENIKMVSQNSLNDLFKYYLPKTATAVNSDKVGGHGIDSIFLLDRTHTVVPKQTFNDLTAVTLSSTNGTVTNLSSTKINVGTSSIVSDGGVLSVKTSNGSTFTKMKVGDLLTDKVSFNNTSYIISETDQLTFGFGSVSKGSELKIKKGNVNLFKKNNVNNQESTIVDTENMKSTLGKTFASLIDDNKFTNVNTFTKPSNYDSLSNRSLGGYMFHIFTADSDELKNNMTWLTPPPTNLKSWDVVNGKVVYIADGVPKYDKDYIYERFVGATQTYEKLMVGNRSFTRCVNNIDSSTDGWSMVYSTLSKPTPLEINAVDRDETLVGSVKVRDYLDIIVDENNTFRIKPDKTSKRVSYAWLEKK